MGNFRLIRIFRAEYEIIQNSPTMEFMHMAVARQASIRPILQVKPFRGIVFGAVSFSLKGKKEMHEI